MLALTLLAAVLAAPGPARGAPAPAAPVELSDAELQERVQAYLGAIDRPVRDESWRALGPAAVRHLAAALASEDLPTRRAVAADGLAAIGGERAGAALVAHARSEAEPYVVRAASVRGAARALTPADAVKALGPVLHGSRSAQLRATAAEALAGSRDATACAAVKAQAAREPAHTRERFSKALARCN